MTISTMVVPNGGWRFVEPPITIRAATFEKLVQLVYEHRQANGKPVGNPTQEIMDQIAAEQPHLRQQKPNPVSTPPDLMQRTISFAHALRHYLQNGGRLVEAEEANRRASICADCHNNLAEPARGGCGACMRTALAGVATLRKMVLNNRTTTSDERLRICHLCGCDLKLKVWFPREYFDPKGTDSNKWPTFCWMK